jgi:hypothetical protein
MKVLHHVYEKISMNLTYPAGNSHGYGILDY